MPKNTTNDTSPKRVSDRSRLVILRASVGPKRRRARPEFVFRTKGGGRPNK